jgi:hypothetical protein
MNSAPNSRGEVASAETCEEAEEGEERSREEDGDAPAGKGCNLYAEHNNGVEWERPRFIAELSARDDYRHVSLNDPFSTPDGELAGDWMPNLGSRTAEISASGTTVTFESTQDLTGYNTSIIGEDDEGEGGSEIFVYNTGAARLMCASCNPSGTVPDAAIQANAGGTGVASYLPVSASQTFMRRWMNTSGTDVFFDSSQPLVTGDGNSTQDVYEWQTEGSSNCRVSTSVYGGCVFLLSGGESTDLSFFVDADETGENVFITHRGALDGAGPHDEKTHLFDLRHDGGFESNNSGCTGTGCQGVPPAVPLFATPASVTFNGTGNFPPPPRPTVVKPKPTKCKKGDVKNKKGKCVPKKKKKAKAKKSAHTNRRTKS